MQEHGKDIQVIYLFLPGACQSFYEALIEAGANFASSPARILIDFVDPLIVAENIAYADRTRFVTIRDFEKETHTFIDPEKQIKHKEREKEWDLER